MSTDLVTATEPVSAEDRAALAESVRDLLSRKADSASARAAMGRTPRIDRPLWRTLCAEIGVAALPIPEQFGGAGATFVESAAVLQELGTALCPVPVYSSALATAAVLLSGDTDAAHRLLPGIASGEQVAAACWAGATGWGRPGVTADAGLLSGTAHYVIDGESADVLVVLAAGGGELTLHAVDADADGVTVTALPVVDPTRPMARIDFDDTPGQSISSGPGMDRRLRSHAWALLAAEQVGGMTAALDLTVEYTKSRKQFGRTIGSFQALKHRMAAIESSR